MAKFELEGNLVAVDLTRFYIGLEFLAVDGDAIADAIRGFEHTGPTREIQVFKTDYGRCRITIEQLPPDKLPEAVVEHDKEAWVRPEALVVFGKDIETARAIIRADCEAHGGVWDDSWYTSVEEIG